LLAASTTATGFVLPEGLGDGFYIGSVNATTGGPTLTKVADLSASAEVITRSLSLEARKAAAAADASFVGGGAAAAPRVVLVAGTRQGAPGGLLIILIFFIILIGYVIYLTFFTFFLTFI
jgi:hypothetical protein